MTWNRLAAVALIAGLSAISLTSPQPSLAATTTIVTPQSVSTLRGATIGDVASLGSLDQSGTQDDPAAYVGLVGQPRPYIGDYWVQLPGTISRDSVQTVQLQTNFRGPDRRAQRWTWLVYNWRTRRWYKAGTNASASGGQWTALTFNAPGRTPKDYVQPTTGLLRVRVQASNSKYNAALDYLAVVITSPDVAPPPPPSTPPNLANCSLFPTDNVWNARVDTLPVDPNSDSYVNALGASTGLHPDFGSAQWNGGPIGIPFNLVSGSQPKVAVSFYYPDESDPGPYPIPANPQIEYGTDHHLLMVDTDQCILYEIYDASQASDGSWSGGSGAIWSLNSDALRPAGWTSADAAGLPILPGLARYDEVAAGHINHALRFTSSAIRDSYIWPARHQATCGGYSATDSSVPPMGQRFRLKASFDISTYSAQTQVILTALKQYGMFLADCGTSWYISGAPDPGWNDDTLVSELRSVPGSAFEAVDESGLMVSADSGAAQ